MSNCPALRNCSSLFSQKCVHFGLVQIQRGATLAHYTRLSSGEVVVKTPSGEVLAPSFYELRHRYTFGGVILGVGNWVILLPIESTQPNFFNPS